MKTVVRGKKITEICSIIHKCTIHGEKNYINSDFSSPLTRARFEKQLTTLHLVLTFHRFNRCVFILLTKMQTETKTVPSSQYVFNVQGCTHSDVPYIVIGLQYVRNLRRVAFVTGHLFTFVVVSSLICLVTTQILICGNQTTQRLEILLRTIVTALLKN